MKEFNIVFLLSHIPNPRINKRITVANKCGVVSVVCARRQSQNIFEPEHADVKHYILDIDLPSSKHLLMRYLVSKRYQREAHKWLIEIKPDLIYTEGLDSLIIANNYKAMNQSARIFFEVADLRECFVEKPKSVHERVKAGLVSVEEKRNFKHIKRLVITSMKFYDIHYYELIDKEKVLYIPNIPDPASFSSYKKKDGGKFTVGFIGGIRYLLQMKMLVDAAEMAGVNVLFAGAAFSTEDYESIIEYCNGKDFVTFTGKYDYNQDIARLYGKVDCVYAVYDADNANVRIALPNKLYEAVYCGLPIIVAKGTYLAEIVERLGVGKAVSHNDGKELLNILQRLKEQPSYAAEFTAACERHVSEMDYFRSHDTLMKHILAVSQE